MATIERLKEYAQPHNIEVEIIDDNVIGILRIGTGDALPLAELAEMDDEKLKELVERWNRTFRKSIRLELDN